LPFFCLALAVQIAVFAGKYALTKDGTTLALGLLITQHRMLHTPRWQLNSAMQSEVIMSISAPTMATIGEIARRLGEPVHRIEYVIRARHIRPTGWAGNARVFPDEAVEAIAMELQRIDAAKSPKQDEQNS
jgi:hypothetical protein